METLIAQAAERQARLIVGRRALEEQLDEMGPISDDAKAWADDVHHRHLERTGQSHHQRHAS